MKKILLILSIFLFAKANYAQTEITKDTTEPTADVVTIEKDSRIDEMMDKKIAIHKPNNLARLAADKDVKVDKYGRVNIWGYRLQLMNSTDRALVYATKGKLYQMYPTQRQYVVAQAPFFKLRFGNFATEAEAKKFKTSLSSMFPNGITIVKDIIESRVKLIKASPNASEK